MHLKALAALLLLAIALPAAADLTGRELIIPVVGRAPGMHGAFWKTDVFVSNLRLDDDIPVLFEFMSDGTMQSFEVWLGPREVYRVRDYVLTKHQQNSAVGVLRISTGDERALLSARAWVYHTDSEGREVGQNVQGVATGSLMREAYLSGLEVSDHARTNIGIANPHDVDAEVWLLKQTYNFDSTVKIVVPARSVIQLNAGRAFFVSGYENGMMFEVRSRVPVYPYASVIRNSSGDPDFVQPARLRPQVEVEPACFDALPLWDRRYAGSRWSVWLRNAADAPALAAKYGFAIQASRENAIAADLTTEQLSAMRCDAAVTYLGDAWPLGGPVID